MFWLAAAMLLNDPIVTGYVERITGRLAPGVAVTITVDAAARAAAQAGSGIRLTTAIVAGAKNEAELAGIIAHEIAHYRSRAERVPPEDPETGLCLRFAAHEPRFDAAKQWEHDADQDAIVLLSKAGYDPAAMLRYFSVLRHAAPDLSRAFSAEDILIERLQLEATDHPMKDPIVDTPEFQAVRERLK
jgi:predicted Zn-dependent protease